MRIATGYVERDHVSDWSFQMIRALMIRAITILFGSLLVFGLVATAWAAPSADVKKSLRIYFVDVEGGQATLFVTPKGQSLLIDTGWALSLIHI